jgi:pimeloyl-ACP methyl ester carboxylesterase
VKNRKIAIFAVRQPLLRKKSRVVYWGTYHRPGNFERMQQSACTSMLSCYLIDGAGHWVQQEKPAKVSELLIEFLQRQ